MPSAADVRATASGSLTTAGADMTVTISGALGAPAAAASPRTMRVDRGEHRGRAPSVKVRMLRPSSAWSGITLLAMPACIVPMVTTAVSVRGDLARHDRLQAQDRRRGHHHGVHRGLGPGAVGAPAVQHHSSASVAANVGTGAQADRSCRQGATCWPRTTTGVPNRSKIPSSIIAFAPPTVSSAGWNTARSVPVQRRPLGGQQVARGEQARDVHVVAACVHDRHSVPSSLRRRATVLAYGSPVFSSTGSASMSARSSTTGPSPLTQDADDAGAADARR